MGTNTGGARMVTRVYDSTLQSVDEAEALAVEMAREAGIHEDDLHHIGMAVRECMVNAVAHGNRYSAHKKVEFTVTVRDDSYSVRIVDQGAGFDLDSLPDPLAEENLLRHSGRGIFLMKAFMDEFRVRKAQPNGTEVLLVKNLGARQ
jgi:serine/threonine-protein kinase RsbW